MLYYVLKSILRPTLRLFYTQTAPETAAPLPETGPLIVISNHPNTLMDPLLVGMLWRRQLHFLTSSRFFAGFGGWVLRKSGAIPLYRQEDHVAPSGAGASVAAAVSVEEMPRAAPAGRLTGPQRAARNDDSFRAAHALLHAGGALLIFPEGSSVRTRRLRPFKLGAARIALGAEARHGWALGVQLVPVGLTYAAPARFRSRVERRIGPPIAVAAYRARYEANPPAAIRALTHDLRLALAAQLLVATSEDDDCLLTALEPFAPLTPTLLPAIERLALADPARAHTVRRRVLTYAAARHRLRLPPDTALRAPGNWALGCGALGLLLATPIAAWGELHNAPATRPPALLARRLTREIEFFAALTFGAALLWLPLCYGLQTWLVARLTHSGALAGAYVLALPLTGWAAVAYRRHLAKWRGQWQVHQLARHRPRLLATLQAEHAALLAELAWIHAPNRR